MIAPPVRLSPTHRIARTGDELAQMVAAMQAAPERAFDFETDGLRFASGKRPIGYSLGYMGGDGKPWCWYVPFRHLTGEQQASEQPARRAFVDVLAGARALLGQNLKFDLNMARADGLAVPDDAIIHDTKQQAYLVNENRTSFSLEPLAAEEGVSLWSDAHEMKSAVENWLELRAQQCGLPLKPRKDRSAPCYYDRYGHAEVPVALEGEYSCRDSAHALLLDRKLRPLAMGLRTEYEDRRCVLYANEMLLVRALADMEWYGQPVDASYLRELAVKVDEDLERRSHDLTAKFGASIDWSNDNDVREFLFERLKLPVLKKTKKARQAALDRSVLLQLRGHHPAIADLAEWKAWYKARTTYTESLANAADTDGRLHMDLMSTGTGTGRFSMREPNLQNIPMRHKEIARAIRRAFLVAPGRVRVFLDYSQIELRMLAWVTRSPTLTAAYRSPCWEALMRGECDYDEYRRRRKSEPARDIHAEVAKATFNASPTDDDWKVKRRAAKIINFGVPYGMGAHGLNENPELLLPEAEAKALHRRYHQANPEIDATRQRLYADMRAKRVPHYVNWASRMRHMPALNSGNEDARAAAERETFASLIQGSAAELTRYSLVRLRAAQREGRLPAITTSTVHDEIQLDCEVSALPSAASEGQRIMEDFHGLFASIPILADIEVTTTTWADKRKYEEEP